MRAGKLRNRIYIKRVTETQSASGALQESWSTFKALWAEINPKFGREYFSSQQIVEELSLVIAIRYYPDIVSKMRIEYGSRVFDIRYVLNVDEMDKQMLLGCVETFNVAISEHAFSSEFTTEFA